MGLILVSIVVLRMWTREERESHGRARADELSTAAVRELYHATQGRAWSAVFMSLCDIVTTELEPKGE